MASRVLDVIAIGTGGAVLARDRSAVPVACPCINFLTVFILMFCVYLGGPPTATLGECLDSIILQLMDAGVVANSPNISAITWGNFTAMETSMSLAFNCMGTCSIIGGILAVIHVRAQKFGERTGIWADAARAAAAHCATGHLRPPEQLARPTRQRTV